jgi:hypothetical protein
MKSDRYLGKTCRYRPKCKEAKVMLDQGLFWLTLIGASLGVCSIYWARSAERPALACWGRRLFLAICVSMGASALLAALLHAQGLTALGLCLGLLVVAVTWEAPSSLSETRAIPADDQF